MSRSYFFLLLAALLMTFVKPAPPADNRPPGDERVLTVELVEEGEAVIEEEVVEEIITEEPPPPPPTDICDIQTFPGNPALVLTKPCTIVGGTLTGFASTGLAQTPGDVQTTALSMGEWGDLFYAWSHTSGASPVPSPSTVVSLAHVWFNMSGGGISSNSSIVRYLVRPAPSDAYSVSAWGVYGRGTKIAVTGREHNSSNDNLRAWVWTTENGLQLISTGGNPVYNPMPYIDRAGNVYVVGVESPTTSTSTESFWISINGGGRTTIPGLPSSVATNGHMLRSDASGKLYLAVAYTESGTDKAMLMTSTSGGTGWNGPSEIPWHASTISTWRLLVTPGGIAVIVSTTGNYTWSNDSGASWSAWTTPIPGTKTFDLGGEGAEENGCRIAILNAESIGGGAHRKHIFTVPIEAGNTLGTASATTNLGGTSGAAAGFDPFGRLILWHAAIQPFDAGIQFSRNLRDDDVTEPAQP